MSSNELLVETEFLDYTADSVRKFVAETIPDEGMTAREKAVALYYAVRDGIHYEVYGADLSPAALRASTIAERRQGFCLQKSILYAAAVRAVGIPSKLISGEVRNHLASDRLKQLVGGEVFLHWLTAIELDGRWLQVTPVFNKLLCKLYRMAPLEFDGTADAVFHPFDEDGDKEMEFVGVRTEYGDVDYDVVIDAMRRKHPGMFAGVAGCAVPAGGSLMDEAPACG